jgi:uncharacterized membrane protein
VAENDEPVDVYVAAYADESAAREDWDAVRALVQDKVITVEALVLVSRDLDGKIHVKEDAHNIRVGTAIGAVGGFVVGVLFPPALVASAVVGAGIGAGTGALVNQVQKHRIKSDVEQTLPPGSSGIVVVFHEHHLSGIRQALAHAQRAEHHHAHATDT